MPPSTFRDNVLRNNRKSVTTFHEADTTAILQPSGTQLHPRQAPFSFTFLKVHASLIIQSFDVIHRVFTDSVVKQSKQKHSPTVKLCPEGGVLG